MSAVNLYLGGLRVSWAKLDDSSIPAETSDSVREIRGLISASDFSVD